MTKDNRPIKLILGETTYENLLSELRATIAEQIKSKNLTNYYKEICNKYNIGSQLTLRKIIESENIYKKTTTTKSSNTFSKNYSENVYKNIYDYFMNITGIDPLSQLTEHFKGKLGYPNSKSAMRRALHYIQVRDNLEKKDTSDNKRIYKLNKDYFEKIDSALKAQIIGFIWADGYIYENTAVLTIELKYTDIEVLEVIKKELQTEKPIEETLKKDKRNGKLYKACRLQIHSKKIINDLKKFGIAQGKSLSLIPNFLNIPSEYWKYTWLGTFDGDGYILRETSKGPNTIGLCGSEETVIAFKKYCEEILKIKLKKPYMERIWHIRSQNRENTLIILNHLYGEKNLLLNRKYISAQIKIKRIAQELNTSSRKSYKVAEEILLPVVSSVLSINNKGIENE